MREVDGEREGGVVGGVYEGGVGVIPEVCSNGGSEVARMLGKGTGAEDDTGGDGEPVSICT